MTTRHKHSKNRSCPAMKKEIERYQIAGLQHGESRQGRALVAIEAGGNPPDSALARAELGLLMDTVFHEAIGWISDDGVNTLWLPSRQPLRTICLNERCASDTNTDTGDLSDLMKSCPRFEQLKRGLMVLADTNRVIEGIATAFCSAKDLRCVQSQV